LAIQRKYVLDLREEICNLGAKHLETPSKKEPQDWKKEENPTNRFETFHRKPYDLFH